MEKQLWTRPRTGSLFRRKPCHRPDSKATLGQHQSGGAGISPVVADGILLLFALSARLWQNSGDSTAEGWRQSRGLAMAFGIPG
jgi:hypothetical protein